ncbi:unnamed protein product [Blumeria hordei]|uniref:Uncharacterized protein n=1 Tax=Blumeria hordei TaxID=2867405 RepID=A0A383V2S1_BLUHO|nr:unnamed protein product [Blumeria hordei]
MSSNAQSPVVMAVPTPCRRSPILRDASLGQEFSQCLSTTLDLKAKSAYNFLSSDFAHDYSPPAPPPPSPVNLPADSWNSPCTVRS